MAISFPRRVRAVTALPFTLVLAVVPAAAQPTPDQLAQRHFESGAAYFEEGDYENALKAFRKAYELSKRPALLLNLATTQERMGDLEGALASLDAYLAAAPEAENAETVRLRANHLRKRVQERRAAAPPEPPDPAPEVAPPTGAVAQVQPTPPAPDRVLPWVLLGVGAASGAGAVVSGLLAQREYDDAKRTCSPRCSDSALSTGRTLAWMSTGLTGLAVVGAGVGTVLLLTSGADPRADRAARSTVPRFGVGVAPGVAVAQARWRF